jgi:hypothetical protein
VLLVDFAVPVFDELPACQHPTAEHAWSEHARRTRT